MVLYILRHAEAEDRAASDAARQLTEKGREQAQRVARFCVAHGCVASTVLSSPFARAEQTARPVAEATGAELLIEKWLASGMSPQTALDELKAYRDRPAVMVVGHEPDLSMLVASLLGLPSSTQVHVRKASLTALEIPVLRPGAAQLDFSLPCRLM